MRGLANWTSGPLVTLGLVACSVWFACAREARASEPEQTENAATSFVLVEFEPEVFWFYEMIGGLSDVNTRGDRVEGILTERGERTPFRTDRSGVEDPASRTAGYRDAAARIVAYMAPGALPDNEANRAYLRELEARLQQVTGLDLEGYVAWSHWYAESAEELRWSEADGVLVRE
jgi:hypothetical protein